MDTKANQTIYIIRKGLDNETKHWATVQNLCYKSILENAGLVSISKRCTEGNDSYQRYKMASEWGITKLIRGIQLGKQKPLTSLSMSYIYFYKTPFCQCLWWALNYLGIFLFHMLCSSLQHSRYNPILCSSSLPEYWLLLEHVLTPAFCGLQLLCWGSCSLSKQV